MKVIKCVKCVALCRIVTVVKQGIMYHLCALSLASCAKSSKQQIVLYPSS
jgi:hypothetical protein